MHRDKQDAGATHTSADRFSPSVGMRCFQSVVANCAANCDPRMDRGSPALQSMMPGAMEQVGNADGSRRSRHLDPCEQRMVIHNGVCQECLIDAAVAEIECRSVVQGAPRGNAREQPIVLAIPKPVFDGDWPYAGFGSLGRFLLASRRGVASRLWRNGRVRDPAIDGLLLRLKSGCG